MERILRHYISVVLHTFFADSACKQLTTTLSQARDLHKPNNLSGDLIDDCVNNFISFFEQIS